MKKYNFDDYTFVYELYKYIYQKICFDNVDLRYENVVPFINFNNINTKDVPKVKLFWEIFLKLVNTKKILNSELEQKSDIKILESEISYYINTNIDGDFNGDSELKEVIKGVSENITTLELYSFFVDTVTYFGFEDVYQKLEKFLIKENYSTLIRNSELSELFKIFKNINFNNSFYVHDYTKLRIRLWSQFDRFNLYIKEYNTYNHIYKKIGKIPSENDEIYIINLTEYDLRNLLINQDILKVKDLKQLDLTNFVQKFKEKAILEKVDIVINTLLVSLKENIASHISDYIGERLKNNDLTVLQYRAQNYTLEFIGDKLGLTRERIRQIESKAKRKLDGFIQRVNHLLSGLHLDKNFATVKIIEEYLGDYASIYLSLTDNRYDNCNLIGLSSDSESYYHYYTKIFKKQNDYYHENEVLDLLSIILSNSNFHISQENLIEIFESVYTKTGQYYFKGRQNLTEKYLIILKYHFNNRQEINLDMIEQFKDKYYEIFGETEIYEREGRAILTRLIDSPEIFLVERGTYKILSKDDINLDEKLYKDIYSFIQRRENVLTEYLFKVFKDRLLPIVNNKYELHGRLKDKFPDLYFAKDTIGIDKNPVVDVYSVLAKYVDERNGRFDLDDLLNDLPMLSGRDMGQYLTLNDEYLAMFNRKFIHKDYFDIAKDEIKILVDEIESKFSNQNVINGQIILNIMKEFTPDLVIRNSVNSNVYAFHIFRIFLNNNHVLSYPDILKSGTNVDTKISFYERNEYIIDNVNSMTQIQIKNIYNIAEEANISINNMKEFLEYFYENGFIRIDDLRIAKKELVINESARRSVKQIEDSFINTFRTNFEIKISDLNFDILPKGINWNNHLLAHLLMSESKILNVRTIGSQYINLDYILEVNKNE